MTADPLQQDLDKYKELLPTLTQSEGKYALIFKGNLLGIFESYSDALTAGYKEAGLQPFLVKRIATTEFVAYFTRQIDLPCHT